MALAILTLAQGARAQVGAESASGLWLVEGEGAEPWLAPQVSSEVELKVSGMIARGRVEQVFENPSEEAVEAVYVFPLPAGAAVDGSRLQVGSRILTGQLADDEAARAAFAGAARDGRVATLISQQRPDVFTTRVANIPPGSRVAVTLTYHELLDWEHGKLSLGVPATLTPRHLPGAGELGDGGRAPLSAAAALDASRLTPPVALDGSGPLLDVSVELERGVELSGIESQSHEIELSRRGGRVMVRLHEGPVLADREFRLRWRPAAPPTAGSEPAALSLVRDAAGARYALAAWQPPFAAPATSSLPPLGPVPPPRDIIFVIDTSRSMAGAPLAQASAALRAALGLLGPFDHFNLIESGSTPRALFEAPRPASALNVAQAIQRVSRLSALGDTALWPALEAAFAASNEPGRNERVVLLSDGAIANERELLRQIASRAGPRRLFTLAVGAAPGRFVLREAARAGRGTFGAISNLAEASARMAELDAELGSPVLEELSLVAPADGAARLPRDLYAGRALSLLARLGSDATRLTLAAQRAGEPWRRDLALGASGEQPLERLWAHSQLEALDAAGDDRARPAASAADLLALAREGGLASRLTSFVAIDPVRSVEQRAPSTAVPLAVPAGSEMFGPLPLAPEGPTCSRGRLLPVRNPALLAARAHVQCGFEG